MRQSGRVGAVFVALAILALAGVPWALAQEKFPSREITLIVPWPAGGGSDISMRLVAEHAQRHFGVPVVVVNKPGAAGAIGHREIVTARPDGYTIGMVGSGALAQQYMIPNPVNILDQFQPIVFFGKDPGTLTVRAETPWRTLKEFVDAAKARPNSIRNANDPPGGGSHLTVLVIEKKLGITLNKISYGGFAPSVAALLAGEVQSTTVPVPDVIEAHRAGKVRILAVADTERHFMAPGVPTFKEQGFDVTFALWRIIGAPRGVPADRLRVLEEKLLATLNDPAFVARANKAGFSVNPLSTRRTEAVLKADDALVYYLLLELDMVRNPK
ncbi:MAG: tripartite tricarboxylate transporter substrate binding protein [Armatimonadota bacterium]|nr:tripartite tricarboxylate transporter substrate binding protein [Armatimonadota bacterium]